MAIICHANEEKYFVSLNGNKNGGGFYEGYSSWQLMRLMEGFIRLSSRKAVIRFLWFSGGLPIRPLGSNC